MELAKLLVAALTPLTVAALGVLLALSTRRFERSQWANQTLIQKRIELLSGALPLLNDLFCYYRWIGSWATLSPSEIVEAKRKLDRLFFANQAFFTPGGMAAYEGFTKVLFKTYSAPGRPAKLRTGPTSRHGKRSQAYPGDWDPMWDDYFAAENERSLVAEIENAYSILIASLSNEVGVANVHRSR